MTTEKIYYGIKIICTLLTIYCKTFIVDFHRSCPNCSYLLCLTCCREIRDGHLQGGGKEVIFRYIDNGRSYLLGGDAFPVSSRNGVIQHSEGNKQQQGRRNKGGEEAKKGKKGKKRKQIERELSVFAPLISIREEIWIYLLAQAPQIMKSQLMSGKQIKMVAFVVLQRK
ncbi:hypothetical protein HYC85_023757 [Camellia sinensis]|uniref:Uncharacterized protein n=1 Tax=Camellia sinensis TaxID=4442 RepID=A0A7J7GJE5_CAMSI|nr:hypothetical protein HYC85_023757 [Camellia sinensis]